MKVSWEGLSNILWKSKIHVPNQQAVYQWAIFNSYQPPQPPTSSDSDPRASKGPMEAQVPLRRLMSHRKKRLKKTLKRRYLQLE